ncbi:protein phosphatase CheZ [Pelagibius litoralis]|uniref:Protein phosphatase CheZ n=1 Tax=Pelagibius litoralis TaxID=374515 RepID=A0A967EXW8_9PROT|nr:protein phosphatase CheZ [Pelagibius litoralis]NIA69446.1 protein phosphatase CheZ [Pelagibius litoralis]
MAVAAVKEKIAAQLKVLQKADGSVDPEELVAIVESIVDSVQGDLSADGLKVYADIEALALYINTARAEIADLRPDDINDEHIPAATDELTAIVGSTEQATNTIFEAVESIEGLTDKMPPEVAEQISLAVTSIFEACGFQDITGQRITKVVTALQKVEEKVDALLHAFGDDIKRSERPKEPEKKTTTPSGAPARPDEDLLNGPQMPEAAISQDDIDALFG